MSLRLRSALAAAVLTAAVSTPAWAEPLAYAVGFDALYRLDLANGAMTRIGAFGNLGGSRIIADVEGVAFAPDGTLYGISDSAKILFRINAQTGVATPVGLLRENGALVDPSINLDFGLAFTCDGRLWASSDRTSALWEVNPADASLRRVGGTGVGLSGLAAFGNELYGISVANGGALHRVDRDNASTTPIGVSFGRTLEGAGLDFSSDGTLWAIFYNDTPAQVSDIQRLDPRTGARVQGPTIEFARNSEEVEVETLAFGPPVCSNGGPQGLVPETVPATSTFVQGLMAAALSLFGLLALRRRAAR